MKKEKQKQRHRTIIEMLTIKSSLVPLVVLFYGCGSSQRANLQSGIYSLNDSIGVSEYRISHIQDSISQIDYIFKERNMGSFLLNKDSSFKAIILVGKSGIKTIGLFTGHLTLSNVEDKINKLYSSQDNYRKKADSSNRDFENVFCFYDHGRYNNLMVSDTLSSKFIALYTEPSTNSVQMKLSHSYIFNNSDQIGYSFSKIDNFNYVLIGFGKDSSCESAKCSGWCYQNSGYVKKETFFNHFKFYE